MFEVERRAFDAQSSIQKSSTHLLLLRFLRDRNLTYKINSQFIAVMIVKLGYCFVSLLVAVIASPSIESGNEITFIDQNEHCQFWAGIGAYQCIIHSFIY